MKVIWGRLIIGGCFIFGGIVYLGEICEVSYVHRLIVGLLFIVGGTFVSHSRED